jgi:hypothetical protein
MPCFRFASVVTALVVATVGVACGSSSDNASASASAPVSADAAWSDTTSTLGVTSWASTSSQDAADDSAELTGYDDAHGVRSQFVFDKTRDAAGNVAVRIRSLVQGPAVLQFRALPDQRIEVLEDTFRDHPDARKALLLAAANMKAQPQAGTSDGSLVKSSSQGLHVLDNAPLVGNQQQLICKDAQGRACERPPGLADTVRDCVVGAGGFAGVGCLVSGAETVGAGCVISAIAAVGGGLICANDVAQRSSCTCVTPCAAQCAQTFNRQYACPSNNTTSCSNAVANDRAQEASCVRGCGAE